MSPLRLEQLHMAKPFAYAGQSGPINPSNKTINFSPSYKHTAITAMLVLSEMSFHSFGKVCIKYQTHQLTQTKLSGPIGIQSP